jgi:hypothetical protein
MQPVALHRHESGAWDGLHERFEMKRIANISAACAAASITTSLARNAPLRAGVVMAAR